MSTEIKAFGEDPETIGKLFSALCLAQAEFPAVPKSGKVIVTKSGTTKPYATLDKIIDCVRPALKRHGVAFSQLMHSSPKGCALTTIVAGHGAMMSTTFEFAQVANPQDMGKLVTYYKRYQLTAALGIVADADADDDSVAENERKYTGEPAPESEPEQKPGEPSMAEQVAACSSADELQRLYLAKKTEIQAEDLALFKNRKAELSAKETSEETDTE